MCWTIEKLTRRMAKSGDFAAQVMAKGGDHDMDPLYERVRARGDLVRTKLGVYITGSHATANEILRDRRFVVTKGDYVTQKYLERPENTHLVKPLKNSLMLMNPPEHTRLRKLVWPSFTHEALRGRTPYIEEVVATYLDRLDTGEPVDLIEQFAAPIPIHAMCKVLGIPDPDVARFASWGSILGPSLDGARSVPQLKVLRATLVELSEFFDELIAFRRREPADDVVSQMVNAELDGRPLDRKELLAVTLLLLLAGLETTLNLIGNGVLAFAKHDDQRRLFIDEPELTENAVEEVLRYDTPVRCTVRRAREDLTVAGEPFKAGKDVLVLLGGGNKDPRVFDDPHRFDIRRPNARDHLAMSAGVHYCLGAGLAKMVGAAALRGLFQRFPDLQLAEPPTRGDTRVIHSALRIPVLCRPHKTATVS
jgi:cytochrome P450